MYDLHSFARLVRDNLPLLLLVMFAVVMLVAWLTFEALRGASSRDELKRLRRKVDELEAARAYAYTSRPSVEAIPRETVLPARWVRKGGAATTSDGGCLVIVADVQPVRRSAALTIRIDGQPGERHEIRTGTRLELGGNLGSYTVELENVRQSEALLGISLRNRHVSAGGGAI